MDLTAGHHDTTHTHTLLLLVLFVFVVFSPSKYCNPYHHPPHTAAKIKGTTVGSECGAVIKAASATASSSKFGAWSGAWSGGSEAAKAASLQPYTAHYYKILDDAKLGELTVRYRQRHDLFLWGFFSTKMEPGEVGEIEEVASPAKKKVKQQG